MAILGEVPMTGVTIEAAKSRLELFEDLILDQGQIETALWIFNYFYKGGLGKEFNELLRRDAMVNARRALISEVLGGWLDRLTQFVKRGFVGCVDLSKSAVTTWYIEMPAASRGILDAIASNGFGGYLARCKQALVGNSEYVRPPNITSVKLVRLVDFFIGCQILSFFNSFLYFTYLVIEQYKIIF